MGAWAGRGVDGLTISEGHVLTASFRNVVHLAIRTTSTHVRPRSCINGMKDGRGSSPETGLAQGSRRRFRGNPPENTHTPLPALSGITVAISAGLSARSRLQYAQGVSKYPPQFRDNFETPRRLEILRFRDGGCAAAELQPALAVTMKQTTLGPGLTMGGPSTFRRKHRQLCKSSLAVRANCKHALKTPEHHNSSRHLIRQQTLLPAC